MADKVNIAPKFEVVLSGEARQQNQSVALTFDTAGGEKFGIEFDAKIVPATITALASLLGQVVSTLPRGKTEFSRFENNRNGSGNESARPNGTCADIGGWRRIDPRTGPSRPAGSA